MAGGLSERTVAIAAAFTRSGLPTKASPEIKREKWKKLLGNVALGAISAVTDMRSFEIMRVPELQEMVFRAIDEAATVANAEGVALDVAQAREVLMKLVDTSGGGTGNSKSSMRETYPLVAPRSTRFTGGAPGAAAQVATPTISHGRDGEGPAGAISQGHMDSRSATNSGSWLDGALRAQRGSVGAELEEKRSSIRQGGAVFEKSKALDHAVNIPAEYGSGGLSAVDTCLAEEQFEHTPTSDPPPSAMSTRCCCWRTGSARAGSTPRCAGAVSAGHSRNPKPAPTPPASGRVRRATARAGC
jgi:hypothetical protein